MPLDSIPTREAMKARIDRHAMHIQWALMALLASWVGVQEAIWGNFGRRMALSSVIACAAIVFGATLTARVVAGWSQRSHGLGVVALIPGGTAFGMWLAAIEAWRIAFGATGTAIAFGAVIGTLAGLGFVVVFAPVVAAMRCVAAHPTLDGLGRLRRAAGLATLATLAHGVAWTAAGLGAMALRDASTLVAVGVALGLILWGQVEIHRVGRLRAALRAQGPSGDPEAGLLPCTPRDVGGEAPRSEAYRAVGPRVAIRFERA